LVYRIDPQAVIEDLRVALALAKNFKDLRKTIRFGWLLNAFKDRFAQQAAPPLIPIFVKLGKLNTAVALLSGLDDEDESFWKEKSEARKLIAVTLAETDQTKTALDFVDTFPDGYEKEVALLAIADAVVERDPRGAADALARQQYARAPSPEVCGGLARVPEFEDLALLCAQSLGGEGHHRAFYAIAIGERNLSRALELIDSRCAYSETVAGFEFHRSERAVLGLLAERIATKDGDSAWAIVTDGLPPAFMPGFGDFLVSCVGLAGPLALTNSEHLAECLSRLEGSKNKVLYGLALANVAFRSNQDVISPDFDPPPSRVVVRQQDRFVDALLRLPLEEMCVHSFALKILCPLVSQIIQLILGGRWRFFPRVKT
jgi:hypothetical protein